MKRQPKGQKNGGQFARDISGKDKVPTSAPTRRRSAHGELEKTHDKTCPLAAPCTSVPPGEPPLEHFVMLANGKPAVCLYCEQVCWCSIGALAAARAAGWLNLDEHAR